VFQFNILEFCTASGLEMEWAYL